MHIELRIEGITVVDEDLELGPLISRLQEAERCGLWFSAPLTFEQAKNLVSRLDATTLELVRQIVLRGGSITWPQAAKICGIVSGDFNEFETIWLEPLNRVVEAVSGGERGRLITEDPNDPAWDTGDMKDVKLDIDGPTLRSLRKVLLG